MTIGEILKDLRQENNLSQAALAEKLGIDKSTIAHYELNKREPKVFSLIKYADFFGVTVDYLIGREK